MQGFPAIGRGAAEQPGGGDRRAARNVNPLRVANVDATRESGTKNQELGTDRHTVM